VKFLNINLFKSRKSYFAFPLWLGTIFFLSTCANAEEAQRANTVRSCYDDMVGTFRDSDIGSDPNHVVKISRDGGKYVVSYFKPGGKSVSAELFPRSQEDIRKKYYREPFPIPKDEFEIGQNSIIQDAWNRVITCELDSDVGNFIRDVYVNEPDRNRYVFIQGRFQSDASRSTFLFNKVK